MISVKFIKNTFSYDRYLLSFILSMQKITTTSLLPFRNDADMYTAYYQKWKSNCNIILFIKIRWPPCIFIHLLFFYWTNAIPYIYHSYVYLLLKVVFANAYITLQHCTHIFSWLLKSFCNREHYTATEHFSTIQLHVNRH